MYEYMADKNKSLKSHYNSKKLDPESFFRNIENDIRKTKTSVDYDMLINIIENAKSYLPIFSNIVVNYYSGLNNNDEKSKNQYKEELESKEEQLLNLSKLLEVKSNELKNHG